MSQYQVKRGLGSDDNKAQHPLRPTLFIGLGGTGLKVLARLRRRIYERYGSPDAWPIFDFLGIDSDEADRTKGGCDVPRTTPVLKTINIGISAEEANRLRGELMGTKRFINRWISNRLVETQSIHYTTGASARRNLGRLLFIHHAGTVRDRIRTLCDSVRDNNAMQRMNAFANAMNMSPKVDNGGVDVVLVGSVGGGTGAGSIIDAAYICRSLSRQAGIREIRAYICLPDVFWHNPNIGPPARVKLNANGYAALREIEYWNRNAAMRPFNTGDWGPLPGVTESRIAVQPFDVCYLISRERPLHAMSREEPVFDMMADALALSIGGSTLATKARSNWSNAMQAAYTGELTYSLNPGGPVEGGPDGDGSDAEVNRAYQMFKHSWSTSFSSLGVASVTLKAAEFRRLASVRLLWRLCERELGAPGMESVIQQDVEGQISILKRYGDLLGELRRSIEDRVSKMAESCATAEEAKRKAREIMTQLSDLAKGVDAANPSLVVFNPQYQADVLAMLKKLETAVEDTAREVAKTIQPKFSEPRERRRSLRVFEELTKRLRLVLQKPQADFPAGEREPAWYKLWADLDERSKSAQDWFLLKPAALDVIRGKLSAWARAGAGTHLQFINERLVRRLASRVLELLEADGAAKNTVNLLLEFQGRLAEAQNDLARGFDDERDRVLTREMAARSDDADRLARLDREIDEGLKTKTGQDDRLGWALEAIGAELKVRRALPSAPRSVVELIGACSRDPAEAVDPLVQTAATAALPGVPLVNNVLDALERASKQDPNFTELAETRERSACSWPLSRDVENADQAVYHHRMFGMVHAPTNEFFIKIRDKMVQHTSAGGKAEGWAFEATDNDPSAAGELVMLHDAHGFSLPSLRVLEEMGRDYQEVRNQGDLQDRHLDKTRINDLPEFGRIGAEAAREILRSNDLALEAILFGDVDWNEEHECFTYSENQFAQPQLVGAGLDAVSSWLRNAANAEQEARLRARIEERFERIESGLESAKSDPSKLEELKTKLLLVQTIDHALLLLGEKVFPPKQDGNASFFPPNTVMIRRIRYNRTRHLIELGRDALGELAAEQVASRAREQMHLRMEFVGPKPPPADGGRAVRALDRLIALRPRPEKEGDRRVLDEAISLGWFPAGVPRLQITSLFPRSGEAAGKRFNPDEFA